MEPTVPRRDRRRWTRYGNGFGVAVKETLLGSQALDRPQPSLVVARRQVLRRWHLLDRVTESVDRRVPHHGPEHPPHTPFPGLVEQRLVGLDRNRPETVHPTQVVHAIHGHDHRATTTTAVRLQSDLDLPPPVLYQAEHP